MTTGYDRDLLFKEVKGIDVDWMEGWGNSPRIMLRGPCEDYKITRDWFEAGIWKQYPIEDSSLWILTHPNGFVKYMAHSGKDINEDGFGGTFFHIHLEGGVQKVLKGPWSSRATCCNIVLEPQDWIMDLGNMACAIRIDAFVELCREFKFQYFVVRQQSTRKNGEPRAVEVSTRPDGAYKPNGSGQWDNDSAPFDVLYSPEA